MELEPNTRLFLVVGKSAEADMLTEAFRGFGTIQSVKVVKEKGVAYIKFEKASSAAAAIENMHEKVLNDGRGPMVKVMFAEAPKTNTGILLLKRSEKGSCSPITSRKKNGSRRAGSDDLKTPTDPDNVPPLSRLFIVVPKSADGNLIEQEMATFQDLQYCKTDLISSKGVVFCKYSKSSSALRALETVQETGMLAGYKVKCMLAEPKGKRSRLESSGYSDPVSPIYQGSLGLDRAALAATSFPGSSLSTGSFLSNPAYPHSPSHSGLSGGSEVRAPSLNSAWAPPLAAEIARRAAAEINSARLPPVSMGQPGGPPPQLQNQGFSQADVGSALGLDGLSHLAGLQAIAAIQGAANLASTGSLSGVDLMAIGKQVGLGGLGGLGNINPAALSGLQGVGQAANEGSLPAAPEPQQEGGPAKNLQGPEFLALGAPLTQLYVVVHKGVPEDILTILFRVFKGFQFCDLKRDAATGQSKGVAFVGYSLPEAATLAVEHLNGIEFPPGSGYQMKVTFAEPEKCGLDLPHASSAISDSIDTILRHTEDGEVLESQRLGSQDSVGESLEHKVEVAAVQNSLSHLSMPQRPEESRGPVLPADVPLPPLKPQRSQPALNSSESDKEGEADSHAKSSLEAQSRTVYTVLARPLPTYALQHYFSRCGPVEVVSLQPHNERYGVVQYSKADSARAALQLLNGTDICGEALNVLPADPLGPVRNKRARR